ncbi:MAG: MraY family glycosyltransferase [Chloroflexota bacterium]|nr:MraY family glycosyltransferase [Chloroflexota bacterium]
MPNLGFEVYALVFGLALAGAWALTALLPLDRLARPAEARLGRRRVGGLAIFAAFLLALVLASLVSSDLSDLLASQKRETAGLLGAALMILLVGVVDDLLEVNFKVKFLVQTAAAALVFVIGYRIEDVALPWGATFSLGWAAPLVTILWLVFITNAMNLIDGKDGVAAGVAIIVAVPLALIAANVDNPLVAAQLVAVAGACVGFLPFNLPTASRLLGDSGALLLGFLLAALAIEGSTGVTDSMFISVPIVALGFPILDTLLAFSRRLLDRKHPFLRDLDHIQHRLEQAGLSDRGVVLSLYALCVLFSGAALTLHFVEGVAAEFGAFFAFGAAITLVLFRLDYAGSLWNSASVTSVRGALASALGLRPRQRAGPPADGSTGSPCDVGQPEPPLAARLRRERRVPASKRRPF